MFRVWQTRHFPKSVSLFRPGQFKRFEVAKSATIETDGFGRERERERERKDGGAEEREARYWGQNGDKKRGQGRISYYKNTNSELPTQAGLPLFEANQPNRRTKGSFERPLSLKETQDLPHSQATDCGPILPQVTNFVGSKFSISVPMRTQASGFQVCHYNKWINLYLTRRRSHSRRLEPLLLWKRTGSNLVIPYCIRL